MLILVLGILLARYGGDMAAEVPHVEACERWERAGSEVRIFNTCAEPLSVVILTRERTVSGDVAPGAYIRATSPEPALWSICPLGYHPSVAMRWENATAIDQSRYHCSRGASL